MSNEKEAEKAAREWDLIARHIAYRLCGNNLEKIGERFDIGLVAALKGVQAGVEWERKRSANTLIEATNSFGKKEGGE